MNIETIATSYAIQSPIWFLILRITFAVYGISYYFTELDLDPIDVARYLTNMSWIGITVYFGTASTISLWWICRSNQGNQPKSHKSDPVKLPWFATKAFRFLFTTSQVLPAFVTLVFWTVLYYKIEENKKDTFLLYRSVAPHVGNLVMVQVELWLSKITLRISNVWYIYVTILLYAAYTWLMHYLANVDFPYPFVLKYMDIEKSPRIAILMLLILLAIVTVVYLLVWFESFLKRHLFLKKKQVTPDAESSTSTYLEGILK